MLSLPLRLQPFPLSVPLFVIPCFGWIFPRVACVGAAQLRAFAEHLWEEMLIREKNGEVLKGSVRTTGCWQLFLT